MKMELKKLQQLKSYGQIKIFNEIRAIFLCILTKNFNALEGPLKMLCDSNSELRMWVEGVLT